LFSQGEELDISPSDLSMTIKWLKGAFGCSGGNAVAPPKWISSDTRASPCLEVAYQPLADDETSREILRYENHLDLVFCKGLGFLSFLFL
jgi:hypothetical protein